MEVSVSDQVQAFLRTIANRCHDCMRRGTDRCFGCDASRAKRLLEFIKAQIDQRTRDDLRCDAPSRYLRVLNILRVADRPLIAAEIDLKKYCSRPLKYWTLRRLVKTGRLSMIFDGKNYVFSLVRKNPQTKENQDGCNQINPGGCRPPQEAAADNLGG